MAYITNLLLLCILFNTFFIKQVLLCCITKGIICTSIITYNSSKLVKNAIVLKDKEKSYKLIISTIAFYCRKANKSLDMLFLKMIYTMCNDSK
jgi:hypothetical protein